MSEVALCPVSTCIQYSGPDSKIELFSLVFKWPELNKTHLVTWITKYLSSQYSGHISWCIGPWSKYCNLDSGQKKAWYSDVSGILISTVWNWITTVYVNGILILWNLYFFLWNIFYLFKKTNRKFISASKASCFLLI